MVTIFLAVIPLIILVAFFGLVWYVAGMQEHTVRQDRRLYWSEDRLDYLERILATHQVNDTFDRMGFGRPLEE